MFLVSTGLAKIPCVILQWGGVDANSRSAAKTSETKLLMCALGMSDDPVGFSPTKKDYLALEATSQSDVRRAEDKFEGYYARLNYGYDVSFITNHLIPAKLHGDNGYELLVKPKHPIVVEGSQGLVNITSSPYEIYDRRTTDASRDRGVMGVEYIELHQSHCDLQWQYVVGQADRIGIPSLEITNLQGGQQRSGQMLTNFALRQS